VLTVVVRLRQPSVGGLINGNDAACFNDSGSASGSILLNNVGESCLVEGDGSANDVVLATQVLEKVVLNDPIDCRGGVSCESVESASAEVLVWVGAAVLVGLSQRVELMTGSDAVSTDCADIVDTSVDRVI